MNQTNTFYQIPILTAAQIPMVRRWLLLSWVSLLLAGFYSIILVAMRTPKVQLWVPWENFFHKALIIHVDLSVLVWLLSLAMTGFTLIQRSGFVLSRICYYGAFIATLMMAVSPFLPDVVAILNNYVPVLVHPVFFIGLGLFGLSIVIQTIVTLFSTSPKAYQSIIEYGCYYLSVVTALALSAGILSLFYYHAVVSLSSEMRYEYLFWGVGHLLQFSYVMVMLIAWIWIFLSFNITIKTSTALIKFLLSLNIIFVLPGLLIYFFYPIDSSILIRFFTDQMRYVGAILPILFLFMGIFIFLRAKPIQPLDAQQLLLRDCLIGSILLFSIGGIIGWLIQGYNVTIPAHYHGSIVGVSLAGMGWVYLWLPQLGFQKVEGRMARLQPWFYGGGQLLHIVGLALSGGYGALRKTPGAVDNIEAQFWMGVMGLGGAMAIIGGLLFVIVVGRVLITVK